MPSNVLGILGVLAALGMVFGGLRWVQVRYETDPEWTRKLAHVLMGLVTLTFPWVFDAFWPVAVLGVLAVGIMIVVRSVDDVRQSVGSVIHSVGRHSYGEIYYPISVVALFALAGNDPVLYAVPLLTLGFADPAAALVGLRHGQVFYGTSEGTKSGEGSAGFFLVAFFCTHVPVLLFTETGRLESLLIALIVGFLVMLLEAIAWRGLDNLFVPVGTFALLRTHLAMDADDLAVRLVVIASLFALAVLWYRETTLDGSATFAAALVGFVSWTIGGWTWLLAPASLYFGYTLLWPSTARRTSDADANGANANGADADGANVEEEVEEEAGEEASPGPAKNLPSVHTVHNVFGVASVGLGWLFLSVAVKEPGLIYPYTLAYAGYLALIGVERLRAHGRTVSATWALGSSTLKSSTVVLLPFVFVEGLGLHLFPLAGGLLLSVAVAAATYLRWPDLFEEGESDFLIHVRRAVLVTATSAIGIPIWWIV